MLIIRIQTIVVFTDDGQVNTIFYKMLFVLFLECWESSMKISLSMGFTELVVFCIGIAPASSFGCFDAGSSELSELLRGLKRIHNKQKY